MTITQRTQAGERIANIQARNSKAAADRETALALRATGLGRADVAAKIGRSVAWVTLRFTQENKRSADDKLKKETLALSKEQMLSLQASDAIYAMGGPHNLAHTISQDRKNPGCVCYGRHEPSDCFSETLAEFLAHEATTVRPAQDSRSIYARRGYSVDGLCQLRDTLAAHGFRWGESLPRKRASTLRAAIRRLVGEFGPDAVLREVKECEVGK